jgi:hypothetical protein
MLEQAGIRFTPHSYEYQPDADRIGLQAAEALHERPERVLKTLMALVDDKPVCAIIPSDREVAMKKLAAAFAGKSAKTMPPADAERISGYKVGGTTRWHCTEGESQPQDCHVPVGLLSSQKSWGPRRCIHGLPSVERAPGIGHRTVLAPIRRWLINVCGTTLSYEPILGCTRQTPAV